MTDFTLRQIKVYIATTIGVVEYRKTTRSRKFLNLTRAWYDITI